MKEEAPDNGAWPSTIGFMVFLIVLTVVQRTLPSIMFGIEQVAISLVPAWLASRVTVLVHYTTARLRVHFSNRAD